MGSIERHLNLSLGFLAQILFEPLPESPDFRLCGNCLFARARAGQFLQNRLKFFTAFRLLDFFFSFRWKLFSVFLKESVQGLQHPFYLCGPSLLQGSQVNP